MPRPEPSPPAATNTTMVPVEEDKIGGDGYGSSKMRASNWRLMGLGNDYLPDWIKFMLCVDYQPNSNLLF